MAAGRTAREKRTAVRRSLRDLARRIQATGMVRYANVCDQRLVTRYGVYRYRIITASNGECAGILQFNGRDV